MSSKFSYNLDALTNDQIIKAIEQVTNPFSAWPDFDERSMLAQFLLERGFNAFQFSTNIFF